MKRGALGKWRQVAKAAALAGLAVLGLKAPLLWVPLAMYGVGLVYSRFSDKGGGDRRKQDLSQNFERLKALFTRRLAGNSSILGDLKTVNVEFYEPSAESPCIVVRDRRGGLLGLGCLRIRSHRFRDFMEGVHDAASRLGVEFSYAVNQVEEPEVYLIVRVHQVLDGLEAGRSMVYAVSEGLLALMAAIYSQCPEADVEVLKGRELERLVEGLAHGRLGLEE